MTIVTINEVLIKIESVIGSFAGITQFTIPVGVLS